MRYLIELVSCKEIVRRNVRYLIELRAVRSLLEMRGILLTIPYSCNSNTSGILLRTTPYSSQLIQIPESFS